jgi:hypothetical protein
MVLSALASSATVPTVLGAVSAGSLLKTRATPTASTQAAATSSTVGPGTTARVANPSGTVDSSTSGTGGGAVIARAMPVADPGPMPSVAGSPARGHAPIIYSKPETTQLVTACGVQLCQGGTTVNLFGASEYQSNQDTGIDHVPGTIALAQQMNLNTIRVINFYDSRKNPTVEPYGEAVWVKVDNMIAAAGQVGMHVDLSLGDYRNILWNNCINPYTADWGQFIGTVAHRQNTVTGRTYGEDPTIATLSLAGEPLQVGAHSFTASGTNAPCTITYSTQDLTSFYTRTLHQWKTQARVIVNTGGLGYLNFNSGIDWKTIFALGDNDICAIKTYGGMLQFAPTVANYCKGINKPWLDEEFGYQQSDGDAARAQEMKAQFDTLFGNGASGEMFWNLGNQVAPTTYDIGAPTPLTMAAVQAASPLQ